MKTAILIVLLLVNCVFGALQWRTANELRAENAALKAELDKLAQKGAAAESALQAGHRAEVARLKKQLEELHQLRGDVARLRGQAEEAAALRASNERLRARSAERETGNSGEPMAAAIEAPTAANPGGFPKEAWSFAGYETPENALVTAIWAMQQGTPETYLDSLAPEEQVRMAQRWQGMSEEEIAAKHQSDVTRITGITVTGREEVSADNIVMNVQIEGVDRAEKVSMKRVAGQWKFAGYIREQDQ